MKSIPNFRSQLDQQRNMNVNEISKIQNIPEGTKPSEKIESPQQT
jgi:hypothetical protein